MPPGIVSERERPAMDGRAGAVLQGWLLAAHPKSALTMPPGIVSERERPAMDGRAGAVLQGWLLAAPSSFNRAPIHNSAWSPQ